MTAVVHVDSPTEGRNPATTEIDRLPTAEVLRLLIAEDATVPAAVAAALPELTAAVDLLVAALRAGGRVHVVGAGTSGRLAALDADELGPTYGLEPGRWTAHVAAYGGVVDGGDDPVAGAAVGATAYGGVVDGEDDVVAGAAMCATAYGGVVAGADDVVAGAAMGATAYGGVVDGEDDVVAGAAVGALAGAGDVLIAVSASGRTPYAVAALRTASANSAATVLLSGRPDAAAGSEVDVHVALCTGPEAVTGSTRLKAGTAQKLALNALSTATMVRCGRTWSNLMVGAVATNSKLRGRVAAALVAATGEDSETCAAAVENASGEGRVALLTLLSGVSAPVARRALASTGGHVREALALVSTENAAPNG